MSHPPVLRTDRRKLISCRNAPVAPAPGTRRQMLGRLMASVCLPVAWARPTDAAGDGNAAASPASDRQLLDDLSERTFRFFWDLANPANGLMPDRWPGNPKMASIAAVGFALTAYVVGVERGWINRRQAADRCLATARFFAHAPQGPQAEGVAGHQGFFYHFLDMQTGHRFGPRVELSTIDSALLLAGLLCAQQYFDREDPLESEIRQLAQRVYERMNWRWVERRPGLVCMGWNPESGFDSFIDYHGYDEAMLMVLLAIGSPTHPLGADAWTAFTRTYDRTWGPFMGHEHLGGAPLFWHQYSHVWVDFKGIQDDFMRRHQLDYFENSRRATLSQQAYAVTNPRGWNGYDAHHWGLTACDGPGMIKGPDHRGRTVQFFDYRARGAGLRDTQDDGTIAPTAALSSLPFAPEIVLPTLRAMLASHGQHIYGRYGFLDSYNTSFRAWGARLSDGREVPGWGWVATDHLGIDQGPIVAMIANHHDGLIWKTMRRLPALRRGLLKAGFGGGWLEAGDTGKSRE